MAKRSMRAVRDDVDSPEPHALTPVTAKTDEDREDDEGAAQTRDPLKLYVRQIGSGRLLTRTEERELARRKDAGDEWAKKKLIESNLRLVMSITRNYTKAESAPPGPDSGGQPRLDPRGREVRLDRMGYKLSTYATWWIRQAINACTRRPGTG